MSKGSCQKKFRFFLGDLSQMWVGGVADSQTRSKPSKPPQIAPKIAFFDPNFTFRSPKSHKTLGWVNRFGRDLPKKNVFFWGGLPLELRMKIDNWKLSVGLRRWPRRGHKESCPSPKICWRWSKGWSTLSWWQLLVDDRRQLKNLDAEKRVKFVFSPDDILSCQLAD